MSEFFQQSGGRLEAQESGPQPNKRFLTESLTTLHIYEKDMIRLRNFKIHRKESHKDAFQRLLDTFLDLRKQTGELQEKVEYFENKTEELDFIKEDLKLSLIESRFIRNKLECELESIQQQKETTS